MGSIRQFIFLRVRERRQAPSKGPPILRAHRNRERAAHSSHPRSFGEVSCRLNVAWRHQHLLHIERRSHHAINHCSGDGTRPNEAVNQMLSPRDNKGPSLSDAVTHESRSSLHETLDASGFSPILIEAGGGDGWKLLGQVQFAKARHGTNLTALRCLFRITSCGCHPKGRSIECDG
jgi:hypothetical protein